MSSNSVRINLDIDETILISIKEKKAEFKKTILFYTAVSLYRKGKLSLGKAAQLANHDRLNFIRKITGRRGTCF